VTDTGRIGSADRAATPSEPSPAVSGKAGIPCAFTPGPWETRPSDISRGNWAIFPAAKFPVLGFACNYPGRTEANARLIAAAPDMFEALDAMVSTQDSGSFEEIGRATDAARAALAKARGDQVLA
jgi:hypothetical protein